jgi:hypothetical protein
MRENSKVLRACGKLVLIAKIYKGANTSVAKMAERRLFRTFGLSLEDVTIQFYFLLDNDYMGMLNIYPWKVSPFAGPGNSPTI